MFHQITLVALSLLVSAVICRPAGAAGNEAVAATIESFITAGNAVLADETDDQRLADIYLYYSDRDFKPIWTRDSGAKTKAKVLLSVLKAAAEHGLDPRDYSIDEIEERLDSTDPELLAELDLLISDVFADYGRDLAKGRIDPASTSSEIHVKPKGPGPLSLIDGAEDAEDIEPYLATVAPSAWEYAALKGGLADYRAIAAAGGWPAVPEGPTLKPGMDDARVPILRKRLSATGEFKGDANDAATVYDEALVDAVKAFQERHGLNGDGAIGPGTFAALNVPVEDRIAQLVINLERRRWIEDDLGKEYVFVNLADARLQVLRKSGAESEVVHEARLVVGEPTRRTPVFTEDMSFVVFNPYLGGSALHRQQRVSSQAETGSGLSCTPGHPHPECLRRGQPLECELVVGKAPAIPAPAGFRSRECARPHQVHVSQSIQHLHPRYAVETAVRERAAVLLARLHACAAPRAPRRGASEGPGLDGEQDRNADKLRQAADREP